MMTSDNGMLMVSLGTPEELLLHTWHSIPRQHRWKVFENLLNTSLLTDVGCEPSEYEPTIRFGEKRSREFGFEIISYFCEIRFEREVAMIGLCFL